MKKSGEVKMMSFNIEKTARSLRALWAQMRVWIYFFIIPSSVCMADISAFNDAIETQQEKYSEVYNSYRDLNTSAPSQYRRAFRSNFTQTVDGDILKDFTINTNEFQAGLGSFIKAYSSIGSMALGPKDKEAHACVSQRYVTPRALASDLKAFVKARDSITERMRRLTVANSAFSALKDKASRVEAKLSKISNAGSQCCEEAYGYSRHSDNTDRNQNISSEVGACKLRYATNGQLGSSLDRAYVQTDVEVVDYNSLVQKDEDYEYLASFFNKNRGELIHHTPDTLVSAFDGHKRSCERASKKRLNVMYREAYQKEKKLDTIFKVAKFAKCQSHILFRRQLSKGFTTGLTAAASIPFSAKRKYGNGKRDLTCDPAIIAQVTARDKEFRQNAERDLTKGVLEMGEQFLSAREIEDFPLFKTVAQPYGAGLLFSDIGYVGPRQDLYGPDANRFSIGGVVAGSAPLGIGAATRSRRGRGAVAQRGSVFTARNRLAKNRNSLVSPSIKQAQTRGQKGSLEIQKLSSGIANSGNRKNIGTLENYVEGTQNTLKAMRFRLTNKDHLAKVAAKRQAWAAKGQALSQNLADKRVELQALKVARSSLVSLKSKVKSAAPQRGLASVKTKKSKLADFDFESGASTAANTGRDSSFQATGTTASANTTQSKFDFENGVNSDSTRDVVDNTPEVPGLASRTRALQYQNALNRAITEGQKIQEQLRGFRTELINVATSSEGLNDIRKGNYDKINSARSDGLKKAWAIIDKGTPLKAKFMALKGQINLYKTLLRNEAIISSPQGGSVLANQFAPQTPLNFPAAQNFPALPQGLTAPADDGLGFLKDLGFSNFAWANSGARNMSEYKIIRNNAISDYGRDLDRYIKAKKKEYAKMKITAFKQMKNFLKEDLLVRTGGLSGSALVSMDMQMETLNEELADLTDGYNSGSISADLDRTDAYRLKTMKKKLRNIAQLKSDILKVQIAKLKPSMSASPEFWWALVPDLINE